MPEPTTTTTTTLAPPNPASSPTEPIASGEVVSIANWNLRISANTEGSDGEASMLITAEGGPGDVMVSPTIEATYAGETYRRYNDAFNVRAVDREGNTYGDDNDAPRCSATNDVGADSWMVLTGGTIETTPCWVVPADLVDGLSVEFTAWTIDGDHLAYLAIDETAPPVPGSTAAGVEREPIPIDAVVGDTVRYLDWEIGVTEVGRHADNDDIPAHNRNGDFALSLGIDISYHGEAWGEPSELLYGVIGASGVFHDRECGDLNDIMTTADIFPGGRVTRPRCVLVPEGDLEGDYVVRIWDEYRSEPLHVALEEPASRRIGGPQPLPRSGPQVIDRDTLGHHQDNPFSIGDTFGIRVLDYIGDEPDWEFIVTDVDDDARDALRARYPDGGDIDADTRVVAATLETTHIGEHPINIPPWEFAHISAVGPGTNVAYPIFGRSQSCALSDHFPSGGWEHTTGHTATVTVCWLIDESDFKGLTMLIGEGDQRRYVALNP